MLLTALNFFSFRLPKCISIYIALGFQHKIQLFLTILVNH